MLERSGKVKHKLTLLLEGCILVWVSLPKGVIVLGLNLYICKKNACNANQDCIKCPITISKRRGMKNFQVLDMFGGRVPSYEKIESEIAPFLPFVRRAIQRSFQAWQEFGETMPLLQARMGSFEQAVFLQAQLRTFLRMEFDGVQEVTLVKKPFFHVSVNTSYDIRVKKLDRQRRHMNYRTPTQEAHLYQEAVDGIDPKSLHLIVGYLLNADRTEIIEVSLSCRYGKDIEWLRIIPEEEFGVEAIPSSGEPNPSRPRISVRPGAKKQLADQDHEESSQGVE